MIRPILSALCALSILAGAAWAQSAGPPKPGPEVKRLGYFVAKGTLSGDTWVYNGESKMNGKVIKGRFTMKELGPTSYTYKFEMSMDGSKWTDIMDGKSTKIK